jgi:hypothetical protein
MKTITVTSPHDLNRAIIYWAGKGLHVTAQTDTSAVLIRPRRPARTFWSALKWSVLTLGLYPLAVLTWWILLAWWVKPIIAASRTDRVTIQAV